MRRLRYPAPGLRGLAIIACAAFVPASLVVAQDQEMAADEGPIEEIVTTGSAIKRVDLYNALPVQVLTADTIERQGITNAGDLIESVPAMQGFFHPSQSVGGGGGGIRTANLRAIGSQYTLSLLDGRRMAPADSGSSIDLSNIPMAAVEQVQILTDGASALYGSDAIAGVVNFILKDSVEDTTVNARFDQPAESGGARWNFDIVTGFGDYYDDGYSVVASYSHERQDQLKAADRDFAETGFIHFRHGGEDLYFQNSSANAIPGNAYVYTAGYDDLIRGFNPNATGSGGVCAQQTTPDGETCRFDYTSTLEIMPETTRDSLTLNGKFGINDTLDGFATLVASQYEMIARIAPYPTGEIPLWSSSETGMSDLVATEVWPLLTAEEQAAAGEITGTWRALPAGNRTMQFETDSYNLTLGLDGSTDRFDWSTALTHAITEIDQSYPTGWLLLDEFVEAGSSGAFNIFAEQDAFTEEDQAALDPAVYHGPWDDTKVVMSGIDAQASMPLFEMGGGDAMLAGGVDYRTTNYDRDIADANRDELLLFLSKDTEYELDRDQWGVFTELLLPFAENFETTVSLRHDDISAVQDKLNGGSIDRGDSDTTYKVSALWAISDAVSMRASYGTGFKAPSMREIGEPLSEFGVTSGTFVCPFEDPDPLAQYCRTSETGDQYDVFRQGYAGLTFESSKQYTAGVVLTPTDRFDMTVDYWNIELEDLVERLTEQQIFDNAEQYRDLFTTKTNLATGQEFLAIIQAAVNVGTREQSGIDYAMNYTMDIGESQLDLNLAGTYMIDSESSLTGSSLGRFGNDDGVVFRNVINVGATLYHGDFTHTLWANFRSGYYDAEQTVEITGTGVPLGQGPTTTVQLEIPSYTVADYQLRYMMLENKLALGLGIKNLLDEEPPLSLQTSGAGHQVGWDPRFTDPYGRTYYMSAEYAF